MLSSAFLIQGTYILLSCELLLSYFSYRRENTVLRGQLFEKDRDDPSKLSVRRNIYVIPNALVAEQFKPRPSEPSEISVFFSKFSYKAIWRAYSPVVTIVVISRLAYRKGIDLLVATAPRICAAFPNVRFVIGKLAVIQNASGLMVKQEVTVPN